MRQVGRIGGIGCLVPHSGPNLALFESCGAMDGESCVGFFGLICRGIVRTLLPQASDISSLEQKVVKEIKKEDKFMWAQVCHHRHNYNHNQM